MNAKLIKRILLWAVGFPLALIVTLAAVLFVSHEIAPSPTEKAVFKVLSIFTPVGTILENTKSVEPAYQALAAKDYDRVMELCDSLQENSGVTPIELNLVRYSVCMKTNRFRAAEFHLKKAVASFSGRQRFYYRIFHDRSEPPLPGPSQTPSQASQTTIPSQKTEFFSFLPSCIEKL